MRRYLIADIIALTCDVFNVTHEEIVERGRTQGAPVHARQCIALLAIQLCKQLSLKGMGRALNRDHSTVVKNAQAAKARMDKDADFRAKVLAVLVRCEPVGQNFSAEVARIKPRVNTIQTVRQVKPRNQFPADPHRVSIAAGSARLLKALQREMAA